jgi:pimeloyl-ACP methyl ester carboxylesterase
MPNKNLLLIHGAWCSGKSFNYVVKKILDDSKVGKIVKFEYDCQMEKLGAIRYRLEKTLEDLADNELKTVVVGHSLGGLLALSVSQYHEVAKTITLAAPLSGLRYNPLLYHYLSYHSPIVKHLAPKSSFLEEVQTSSYGTNPIDVLAAVNGYNPMIYEPNDGVISIETQTKWTPYPSKLYRVDANHNEILMAADTIIAIERALAE